MRLIFIDPNFTEGSPSMRAIVRAVPDLLRSGVEVEVWCWNHEQVPGVRFRLLPHVPIPEFLMRWLFVLSGWVFFMVAHGSWFLWRISGRKRRGDVLVSNGFYLLCADAALVHFSQIDWLKAQFHIGLVTLRSWLDLGYTLLMRIPSEMLLLWNPLPTRLISVSDSVSDDMKRWGAPWKAHSVLPNPYDPERYNQAVRCSFREVTRASLGMGMNDPVFVFASMAQYHRKGFWLAAKAISLLRNNHPNARFLVIGGYPRNVEALKKKSTKLFGDWSSWLHFTGMTREMPKYLAAADALLFPSYSEAFALVEIEAAAMGLRLYLTPHHGSEMILREGQNGREIPWNTHGIVRVLEEELAAGLVRPGSSSHGNAPSQTDYAGRLLGTLGITV